MRLTTGPGLVTTTVILLFDFRRRIRSRITIVGAGWSYLRGHVNIIGKKFIHGLKMVKRLSSKSRAQEVK